MDDVKRIPVEWIDRIFKRLDEIYGVTFLNQFNSDKDFDLERTRWQSGLHGATPDEIKKVLDMCRTRMITSPPNIFEFYRYCKGYSAPVPPKPSTGKEPNKEIAQQYLKLIRDKLHGKLGSDGQAALSALDQQVLAESQRPIKDHWQDR